MGEERDTVAAAREVAPLLCLEWKEDRDGGLQPVTSRSRGGGSGSRPWKTTPAGKSPPCVVRPGAFLRTPACAVPIFLPFNAAGAAVQKQLLELQHAMFVYS